MQYQSCLEADTCGTAGNECDAVGRRLQLRSRDVEDSRRSHCRGKCSYMAAQLLNGVCIERDNRGCWNLGACGAVRNSGRTESAIVNLTSSPKTIIFLALPTRNTDGDAVTVNHGSSAIRPTFMVERSPFLTMGPGCLLETTTLAGRKGLLLPFSSSTARRRPCLGRRWRARSAEICKERKLVYDPYDGRGR